MVIWERYLVYAVALGVTAEVARALEAHIPRAPDGSMQPGFAPWFIGYHGVGALGSIGGLSDFAHSFGPTIAAAVAPPSSSSSGFGGGGFPGGGGGGGGGGMGASSRVSSTHRSSRRQTSLRPDHVSSMAHTLVSTKAPLEDTHRGCGPR